MARSGISTLRYNSYGRRFLRSAFIAPKPYFQTESPAIENNYYAENGYQAKWYIANTEIVTFGIDDLANGTYFTEEITGNWLIKFKGSLDSTIYERNFTGVATDVWSSAVLPVGSCNSYGWRHLTRNGTPEPPLFPSTENALCLTEGTFVITTQQFTASNYSYKFYDDEGVITASGFSSPQTIKIDYSDSFKVPSQSDIGAYYTVPSDCSECNCGDFRQVVTRPPNILLKARDWQGSNAGPFNPCKHIMAVKRFLQISQSYPPPIP